MNGFCHLAFHPLPNSKFGISSSLQHVISSILISKNLSFRCFYFPNLESIDLFVICTYFFISVNLYGGAYALFHSLCKSYLIFPFHELHFTAQSKNSLVARSSSYFQRTFSTLFNHFPLKPFHELLMSQLFENILLRSQRIH